MHDSWVNEVGPRGHAELWGLCSLGRTEAFASKEWVECNINAPELESESMNLTPASTLYSLCSLGQDHLFRRLFLISSMRIIHLTWLLWRLNEGNFRTFQRFPPKTTPAPTLALGRRRAGSHRCRTKGTAQDKSNSFETSFILKVHANVTFHTIIYTYIVSIFKLCFKLSTGYLK